MAAGAAGVDAQLDGGAEGEMTLREGESIEEFRARLKPRKKSTAISAELLDTANSYDDKVTVVRMMVSQDAKRVALVLKNLVTKDIR
jgi:flagellar M-ring protein FliF